MTNEIKTNNTSINNILIFIPTRIGMPRPLVNEGNRLPLGSFRNLNTKAKLKKDF